MGKLKGDGKGIVEILNIGFEPLLTETEYESFLEKSKTQDRINRLNYAIDKMYYRVDRHNLPIDIAIEIVESIEETIYAEQKILLQKKSDLKNVIASTSINEIRTVHIDRDFKYGDQFRHIAIFESDLARTFGCDDRTFSDKIVSVVTYYTEIFESIMYNGFMLNGEKYVFFTAGAGQTRNKKSTFVKEVDLEKHRNKLFCGLTYDIVNSHFGMNSNKFLAYTSLCQSNTEIWEGFDIDKSIVVDDIEFDLQDQDVRFINVETLGDRKYTESIKNEIELIKKEIKDIKGTKGYTKKTKELREIKKSKQLELKQKINSYYSIEEKTMNIPIPFTDGFGIILGNKKEKAESFMVRLPFVKGLMSYAPYSYFKEKYNVKNAKIIDIYGKQHNIKDVKYIFTKSQFKMYKYYDSWDDYKEKFKKYECDACRCNKEKNKIKLNANTNYQVLQALTTEMSDEDILDIAKKNIYNLEHIGDDYRCMLDILGVDSDSNSQSNLQKALGLYPEMLRDTFVRSQLVSKKKSIIKQMNSGKFEVNGAYTFIIPDVLACMQWWILGERDLSKLGGLGKDEIFCSLFDDKRKVDCLRAPALDHAHCIRINNKSDENKIWYRTQGLYIGVNDNISKFLQCDFDGDISLVHDNETIIKNAESFQKKYKMLPNYYEMGKAEAKEINVENIFNGIVMAYHHGNIGSPSNDITKIWGTLGLNSSESDIETAINSIAIKTATVNFTIDFCKTLWKPEMPNHIKEQLKNSGTKKVPNFFRYAKDKTIGQCENVGVGNIDRIKELIPKTKISYKDVLPKYDYRNLMSEDIDVSNPKAIEILNLYLEINKTRNNRYNELIEDDSNDSSERNKYKVARYDLINKRVKKEMTEKLVVDDDYIVNVLVKLLYKEQTKNTLWDVYGDIILKNLSINIGSTKWCEVCGERFEYNTKAKTPKKYCIKCESDKNREKYSKYNEKR